MLSSATGESTNHDNLIRMHLRFITAFLLCGLVSGQGSATVLPSIPADLINQNCAAEKTLRGYTPSSSLTPDTALRVYENRTVFQDSQLESYSSITLIRAALPRNAQQGTLELLRSYVAPHSLRFGALHYSGDSFVRNNIILRLLQSEAVRMQKSGSEDTAITRKNYKFSYMATTFGNGCAVHVYRIKPRVKRPGLFKGEVYLDAVTGSILRAEGSLVKLPSFFLKKVDFVREYADVGRFTFPVHLHSDARARFLGSVVVDVHNRNYRASSRMRSHDSLVVGHPTGNGDSSRGVTSRFEADSNPSLIDQAESAISPRLLSDPN